ncbi:MAG: glycoside hydrolase family 3 C-terminal domain-containing protein [Treponema sp.]|nr:glycoside hydrolase family 3 C-terminal domain-containing protein [Treponema sp.]
MENYEIEHLASLRPYLAECTVLLKKSGNFPLNNAGKIALYGSGVRRTMKGGTGSGEVNSRFFTTVEEGFEKAGFEITSKAWLDEYDRIFAEAKHDFRERINEEAKAAGRDIIWFAMGRVMAEPEYDIPLNAEGDCAVYVLSRICGEGSDRKVEPGDYLLSETEKRDILLLAERYPKFMLVLNAGGPVDLSPVLGKVQDILVLSQLGVETGAALADIVLGKENPSGKLTTSWASYNEYPFPEDFAGYDDTCYREGVYVGYRYFDSVNKTPDFPFGFGLSYTSFKIEKGEVTKEGTRISVGVKVINTGSCAGKEVVQLYVSVPEGRLDQPYQTLAAFEKTPLLKAGESCQLKISFSMEDISSYSEELAAYVLEKGEYILRLGNSSRSTEVCGKVKLSETAVITKVKNVLGKSGFEDWKPDGASNRSGADAAVPVLELKASDFVIKSVSYEKEYPVDEEIKKLTDEELCLLSIGFFWPQGKEAQVVGNSGNRVAGAAGESISVGDIPSIVMADGPAGVRICKKYYQEDGRCMPISDALPASFMDLLTEEAAQKLLDEQKKLEETKKVEYQYATAIPIGTAIAQSFNEDFAELCGDIVGEESVRFGVHLWLAPAQNIHRNVLCGRNFEYYSEDPLVSGKMSAAITKGVQKHEGCGVTIKHFAANNQELNRTSSNSCVSERAMREIYLRGFEICVKEANPLSVMSSYNLVNGVHTNENPGLLSDILRCEWGFESLLMTDWVINGGMIPADAKHKSPTVWGVTKAGGDVFMPGSQRDFEQLAEGFKAGKVSRNQLEINATRIRRLAKKLNK